MPSSPATTGDRALRIRRELLSLLGDPSVPRTLRRKAADLAEPLPLVGLGLTKEQRAGARKAWNGLTVEEREARMDAFLERLEEQRYADHAAGIEQLWGGRSGRPPKGALPTPDDTPWVAPRARRKRR